MGAWTFLIPGLAQFSAGKSGKGLALLLGAAFGGAVSGGLVWLLCGAWSYWEYRGVPKFPEAAARLVESPSASSAPPSPGRTGNGDLQAAALKYGAALIGMGMILFYANHKGLTFKVLDLVGLVKVEFHDSRLLTAGRDPAPDGASTVAAEAPPIRVLQDRRPAEESKRVEIGGASPAADPSDLEGLWHQADGAEYRIFQSQRTVRIKEYSRFLFLPVETADCRGEMQGVRVRASCRTIFDTQGEMDLHLSQDRSELTGTYTDAVTGARIGLAINR